MAHEIFISTDGTFLSSLRYIDTRLEPFKKSGEVTARITKTGERSVLTVAFDGAARAQTAKERKGDSDTARKIAAVLVDAIADVVITDCKFHFIESSIKLSIEDKICHHAFIRALSSFDRSTDKAIAKSLVHLSENFLLDSFYAFSIDTLKQRWQEVCALANDNACFLVCDGTFRELLRFLISNLESHAPEVHLFNRAGRVEMLANNLKPINVYVNDELPEAAALVSKLIQIAPKRIFLHQEDVAKSPVIDIIQNLFGGCVQVVQN